MRSYPTLNILKNSFIHSFTIISSIHPIHWSVHLCMNAWRVLFPMHDVSKGQAVQDRSSHSNRLTWTNCRMHKGKSKRIRCCCWVREWMDWRCWWMDSCILHKTLAHTDRGDESEEDSFSCLAWTLDVVCFLLFLDSFSFSFSFLLFFDLSAAMSISVSDGEEDDDDEEERLANAEQCWSKTWRHSIIDQKNEAERDKWTIGKIDREKNRPRVKHR